MIRDFMRFTFPAVLDILFILSIIGVLIAAFSAFAMSPGFFMALLPFISVLVPGIVGVVVAFGVIFAMVVF